MPEDRPVIRIIGTISDGTFIADIRYKGRRISAFYPAHVGNLIMLHTTPVYVTRFVVFSENDANLHPQCKSILMREDLELDDESDSGLVKLFREAMAIARTRKKR